MKEAEIKAPKEEGLFYSPQEKILFWIPRYYTNGSGDAEYLIKNIQEGIDKIREFGGAGTIYTHEITVSPRYKYMWSFHAYCDKCPKEAFEIGNDWTMNKWITD